MLNEKIFKWSYTQSTSFNKNIIIKIANNVKKTNTYSNTYFNSSEMSMKNLAMTSTDSIATHGIFTF